MTNVLFWIIIGIFFSVGIWHSWKMSYGYYVDSYCVNCGKTTTWYVLDTDYVHYMPLEINGEIVKCASCGLYPDVRQDGKRKLWT